MATRPIATRFHLLLFADETVEFSLSRFNFWPPNPAKFKQLPEEVESWIFITSNDDFGTKIIQSLPNWRTRGNCREDGAHEILKGATTVFTKLLMEKTAVYFFQGTITGGYPPRNAPLQSPQSRNDSRTCTPLTSQWRANRYSVSPFAANKTQIGRAPQMPDSHNPPARSRVHWSCVQLKQHRQWPENDGNWKLPPTPGADNQIRIKTRSDTEYFPV